MSSQKRPLKDQYKTGESKLPLWASLTYNAPTVIQQQSYLFNIQEHSHFRIKYRCWTGINRTAKKRTK